MEYPINQLNIENYDQLIHLWNICGLDHRPIGRDSKQMMEEEFGRAETCILGMFDGEKLIGSIIGSSDGRKGWINRLAIDPDYRGQGLAGILIESCEQFLNGLGLKVISCLIEDKNTPSMSAFEKAGYSAWPEVVYFSKRSSMDD